MKAVIGNLLKVIWMNEWMKPLTGWMNEWMYKGALVMEVNIENLIDLHSFKFWLVYRFPQLSKHNVFRFCFEKMNEKI